MYCITSSFTHLVWSEWCVCLHQARLEVHRFGITGYKKEQQRVFEKDRAVMLGARVRTSHNVHISCSLHLWECSDSSQLNYCLSSAS